MATLLLLVVIAGCSREPSHQPYVARVDHTELTESDLAAVRDTSGAGPQISREYVNDWIVTELLYQEAVRRGLIESAELQRQLEATKKRLAIAALLDKEVYGIDDTLLVNEDSVVACFRANSAAFVLREDVVLASYTLFDERDAANTFRSAVLRGTPWNDAIARNERDSVARSHLLRMATRQYFTQGSLYPPELWKLVRTLGKDEVSFVVKGDNGYYVLRPHGMKRQGEIPDLDYVRGEVRDRLLLEQRRIRYDKLVATLRGRHSVDVRIDLADTAGPSAD